MPWNASAGVGFSPDDAAQPWLPIPPGWQRYAVSQQNRDGGSMLTLYRRALALRAAHPAFAAGEARVTRNGDVLTVRSVGGGETLRCVVNMGTETVLVGCSGSVLLASVTRLHRSGRSLALPPDTAVWLTED
jgi:alpha-glucosidase